MAYFWIYENAIAGTSSEAVEEKQWPQGFSLHEGPDLPLENIYWSGDRILEKPPQPNPDYLWSESDRAWVLPYSLVSLEEAKRLKLAELSGASTALITGGFESSALGTPHRYSSEASDRENLMQAKEMAEILNAPIEYICVEVASGKKDGKLHSLDQFKQLIVDGGRVKSGAIYKFHELREQVEAAKTKDEVQAIVWG